MITADQYRKLCDLSNALSDATAERVWAASQKGVESDEYRTAQKASTTARNSFNEYAVSLVKFDDEEEQK